MNDHYKEYELRVTQHRCLFVIYTFKSTGRFGFHMDMDYYLPLAVTITLFGRSFGISILEKNG